MTPGAGSSTRGRLLLAGPGLEDPNFRRTVVFMLEHGPEGALGLVLNRPSPVDVAETLPRWHDLSARPATLFRGGPVEAGGIIGLGHVLDPEPPAAVTLVHDQIAVLDLEADPALLAATVGSVRLFTGYAGWGPGQLEGELAMGGWIVVDSEPGDVVTDDPEDLWRSVLARQPDQDLALLARYPDDPSVN